MYICVYGDLDLSYGFGGQFTVDSPSQKPDIALYAIRQPPQSCPRRQSILFTDDQIDLALALASWLSFRESSFFTKIMKFRLQAFQQDDQSRDLVRTLLGRLRLSPESSVEIDSVDHPVNLTKTIPNILFPTYPETLYTLGNISYSHSDLPAARGHYESALQTMMGWGNRRDHQMNIAWKRLFFDVYSANLVVQLRQGGVDERIVDRECNNALSWCFEQWDMADGQTELLIPDTDKRVKFLMAFAQAKESWGQPERAYTLIMSALRFSPNHADLLQKAERLQPEVDHEILDMIASFKEVFASPGLSQSTSRKAGPSDESSECAICLKPFKAGDDVEVLTTCAHMYHASGLHRWLREPISSGRRCPLCRSNLY